MGRSWQREAGVLSRGQLWGCPPLPLLSDAVETVFLSQAAHCTHTGDWGSPHGAEAAGSPLGRLLPSLPTSLLTLPGSQCVQVWGGQGPVAGDGPTVRAVGHQNEDACRNASKPPVPHWSRAEALHAPLTDHVSWCRACSAKNSGTAAASHCPLVDSFLPETLITEYFSILVSGLSFKNF